MIFFFFSSRRRHTRSLRDWSSDVCSSDLNRIKNPPGKRRISFRISRIVSVASTRDDSNVSDRRTRSEEHTSELQSRRDLVCRLLLEKKKNKQKHGHQRHDHVHALQSHA